MRRRVSTKSPVRENCTPGSVRGLLGNWQSYRDLGPACLRSRRQNHKTEDRPIHAYAEHEKASLTLLIERDFFISADQL